uniref:Uncharacterized protein n=1 Tax=Anopheles atroparvus TaxID=41427 RepID=A0A182IVV4_ANOAO
MKCLGWIALCAVGLVLIGMDRSEALPGGCYNCAKNRGYPQEKCCDECPTCRYNFDVEAPPDPGCKKVTRYHYDVEKITGCHQETYDRLDAAVEVLPQKGCRKSYQYHYDVEKPCDCYEENYDTYDFEVVAPKKEKKCKKVKLEAYADHPVRDCQCDCNQRRPADQGYSGTEGNIGTEGYSDLVGSPRRTASDREQPVYIGDSSNPITYDQIKRHMDALPRSEYSPSTNDIIGNLTVLFYDIYQQKHRKNFTLPLKYGTRTVVDKGDGLQKYDIKPIEGEYQPPKLNRFASRGLNLIGRKIDRKTGRDGPRRNGLQRRP